MRFSDTYHLEVDFFFKFFKTSQDCRIKQKVKLKEITSKIHWLISAKRKYPVSMTEIIHAVIEFIKIP